MLRIIAHRFGPPEAVLDVEPCAAPIVADDGAVVRMIASPINPSDRLTISGAYPHRTQLPFVPGFEGVGIVAALGRQAQRLEIGQRVLPLGFAGSWQSCKALPADWCVVVPGEIKDDQAATAYINPLTARLMIDAIAPTHAATIGINAAASNIGRTLIRLVHALGRRPIAVVRSPRAKAMLADEPVFDILTEGHVLPPLDAALDAVGGASGARLAAAIRRNGLFLHYGLLSGEPLPTDLAQQAIAQIRLFWLRSWVHAASRQDLYGAMANVFADMRAGLVVTDVGARYPLAEVHAALRHDADPSRRGKVLLVAD